MTSTYAKRIPKDATGEALQGVPPAFTALQSTNGSGTVSSMISLTDQTTFLEVTAVGAPVALKWGAASVVTTAGSSNFDAVIPPNGTRQFVIPVSVMGVTSVAGANVANGLYPNVSFKSFNTSASVLTTEY